MPSIDDFLFQVFERKGYRVTANATLSGGNGAVYHVPLLAQAGHATILVDWNTTEVLDRTELNNLVAAMRDVGATRGVFLALNGWENGLAEEATAQDVEVWDHARVALEIGEAVLAPVLGPLPESFHVGRITSGIAPGASTTPLVSVVPATPSAPPATPAPAPAPQPAAVSVLAQRAAEAAANRPTGYARPQCYERDILRHTRGKLAGDVATTLEYVPQYAFEYQCGYRATNEVPKPPAPVKGTLLVNALTGACRDGTIPEVAPKAPQEGAVMSGKFQPDQAREHALQHALKTGVKEVNAVQNRGGTMWVEKKRVQPSAEESLITPRGSFYLPVWKIDGANGYMRIDAVSNTVLEESYEPIPPGRDAEFV